MKMHTKKYANNLAIDEALVEELMRVEPGMNRPEVALRRRLLLYANDTDFDDIPGLKRYRP